MFEFWILNLYWFYWIIQYYNLYKRRNLKQGNKINNEQAPSTTVLLANANRIANLPVHLVANFWPF